MRLLKKHLAGEESSCSDLRWTLEAPQQVTLESFPLQAVSYVRVTAESSSPESNSGQANTTVIKAAEPASFTIRKWLLRHAWKKWSYFIFWVAFCRGNSYGRGGEFVCLGRGALKLSSGWKALRIVDRGRLAGFSICFQHLLNICKYMGLDLA